ncbi:MAG: polysaccharide biosynthesis tyrosine autokinase [Deltaproteobacteria bacterium]|nr:polysaccharide biosynthesis tyrosine autokinase [Deltaproteobacteria bacterium]
MNEALKNDGREPKTTSLPEVHFSDYVAVVMRRRVAALVAAAAVFLGFMINTFYIQPYIYEATTTLRLLRDGTEASAVLGNIPGVQPNIDMVAELEILRSRTLGEEVASRLGLNWNVTNLDPTTDARIIEMQAPPAAKSYWIKLTGDDTYELRPAKTATAAPKLTGRSGEGLKSADGSLRVTLKIDRGKSGDEFKLERKSLVAAGRSVRKEIVVSERAKGASIIQVVYRSTSPELAAKVPNALVESYYNRRLAQKSEEASRTADFIDTQIEEVRGMLETAEAALGAFKSRTGVVSVETQQTAVVDRMREIETAKISLEMQRRQLQLALRVLDESMKTGEVRSVSVLPGNPAEAAILGAIRQAQTDRENLLVELKPENPAVLQIDERIKLLQRQLSAVYSEADLVLRDQIESVQARMTATSSELKSLPVTEQEFAQLSLRANIAMQRYTLLLQKREEARIRKAATTANVELIDAAVPPSVPISPNRPRGLLVGLLAGLLCGIAFAFLLDFLDDSLKEVEVASHALDLPSLGVIPMVPSLEDGRAALLGDDSADSVGAEAFRMLRTNLQFAGLDPTNNVLAVTSALPGEGKSTNSANLALALAQLGGTVVVVGGDLRRPSVHQTFGVTKEPGLTEVLAGQLELDAVIQKNIEGKRVDVLPSGQIPPNPAELLGSPRMKAVIETLRARYAYVVIDAPPVLLVSDASILAPQADATILVVEAGATPRRAAERAREALARSGSRLVGFIMNDKRGRITGRGYYGYKYGYHYGYYGTYGTDGAKRRKRSA